MNERESRRVATRRDITVGLRWDCLDIVTGDCRLLVISLLP